ALAHAACAAWSGQGSATDLDQVKALRATADRDAAAAGRLDPRWSALTGDLVHLRAVERAYVRADVNGAYQLRPEMDALRARIGTRC
ncbi:MAG: hypothetical protein WCD35_18580, partial [Mycobacteriales bacterium]